MTGLTSINDAGKNALVLPKLTVNPPRTRSIITPLILRPSANASSNARHDSERLALSRDNTVAPLPSSSSSRITSTSSPMLTSSVPSGLVNSSIGIDGSVFKPALTITLSLVIAITLALITDP